MQNEYKQHKISLTIPYEQIQLVLINEVVPQQDSDDFYASQDSTYARCIAALFEDIPTVSKTPQGLLQEGIYITNALKQPKINNTYDPASLPDNAIQLAEELAQFPNVKAIMAMGDVAKKAVNLMAKQQHLPRVFPAGSTYKQRNDTFYWNDIRVFPAYIMTGQNIKIEKSKFEMNVEEIQKALSYIKSLG